MKRAARETRRHTPSNASGLRFGRRTDVQRFDDRQAGGNLILSAATRRLRSGSETASRYAKTSFRLKRTNMALFDTPLSQVTVADLKELVDSAVSEGLRLEFKRDLPGSSDADKREFLADVSAFANSAGGDLLLGVAEDSGRAARLVGIDADMDQEVLRLTSILRMGVEPRLPALEMRPIRLEEGTHVLVIRVRRSWLLPHMVTFKGLSRFYSRSAAGKHQLDVSELRSLFRLGSEAERHAREFRASRLGLITAQEIPVIMEGESAVVLHLLPLAAFGLEARFDYRNLQEHIEKLQPLNGWGSSWRHNLDGFVVYSSRTESAASSYVQMLRNGALEAVETAMLQPDEQGRNIPSVIFERELVDALPRYLDLQQTIGVRAPIVAMLSLLNVRDFTMAVSSGRAWHHGRRAIDRRDVLAPEVLIEDYDVPTQPLVKQLVDPIWNAAGWPQSHNFDDAGLWKLR